MGMTNSSDPVLLTETGSKKKNFLTPCSVAMSGRIVRLSCERFLKQGEPSRCAFRHYAVSQWDSAQDQIVRTEVTGSFTLYALDFCLAKAWLNRTNNAQRDFVLQGENVVKRTVETLRPKMHAGLGIN